MTTLDYATRAKDLFDRLVKDGVDVKGKVIRADVYHDKWCPIYLGSSMTTCLCNPDVTITVDGVAYRE